MTYECVYNVRVYPILIVQLNIDNGITDQVYSNKIKMHRLWPNGIM